MRPLPLLLALAAPAAAHAAAVRTYGPTEATPAGPRSTVRVDARAVLTRLDEALPLTLALAPTEAWELGVGLGTALGGSAPGELRAQPRWVMPWVKHVLGRPLPGLSLGALAGVRAGLDGEAFAVTGAGAALLASLELPALALDLNAGASGESLHAPLAYHGALAASAALPLTPLGALAEVYAHGARASGWTYGARAGVTVALGALRLDASLAAERLPGYARPSLLPQVGLALAL